MTSLAHLKAPTFGFTFEGKTFTLEALRLKHRAKVRDRIRDDRAAEFRHVVQSLKGLDDDFTRSEIKAAYRRMVDQPTDQEVEAFVLDTANVPFLLSLLLREHQPSMDEHQAEELLHAIVEAKEDKAFSDVLLRAMGVPREADVKQPAKRKASSRSRKAK